MFAEKSRLVARLMNQLTAVCRDLENNRGKAEELVNTVNALIIPRAWIGVDSDGRIHVTRYGTQKSLDGLKPSEYLSVVGGSTDNKLPVSLNYVADYIWDFDQVDNTLRCVKSRDGRWL